MKMTNTPDNQPDYQIQIIHNVSFSSSYYLPFPYLTAHNLRVPDKYHQTGHATCSLRQNQIQVTKNTKRFREWLQKNVFNISKVESIKGYNLF